MGRCYSFFISDPRTR